MPKSYKTCEIMQQLDYMTLEQLERGLDHNAVKDYAYILHDKDENENGELKKAHWHICLRFKDSVPTKSICDWFGISENYINKIRGRFADALAYLTHKNAPDKYQYLDEEVKSNFDFKKEVETLNSKKVETARREEIVELITNGIIREFNYTDYISAQEFDKFKRSIDNAFAYRRDKLEGSDRNMQVIYIYGKSGTGKTTYAKELAQQNDYSYYVSSGSNDLFDNYKGQDCIILDDVRPTNMELSDFLKILDNHTQSTVKSRYKNKLLECKLMIITTSLSLDSFFKGLYSESFEDSVQLRRRCELIIKMTDLTMSTYLYQPESGKHVYISTYDNPVAGLFRVKDKTKQEAEAYVDNLLSFPKRAETVDEWKPCTDSPFAEKEKYEQCKLGL